MTKILAGVLMGGMSLEKEVSFNSGRTVCDHLDTQRYTVIPLFQDSAGDLYHIPQKFLYRGKISDFECRLSTEATRILWSDLSSLVDIIFIAQHGRYGEDGCIQGLLEFLNIPYVGSKIYGSALGMDKYIQKFFLSSHNIKTPHGIRVFPDDIKNLSTDYLLQHNLHYPLIVKPVSEGSSFGVTIVHDHITLIQSARKAAYVYPEKPQSIIIEEKIEGMEFSCIVMEKSDNRTYEALSVTEIVAKNNDTIFDYEQKYMPGRSTKWTPARCSTHDLEKIKDVAQKTMRALDFCTLSRIDGFLTPQGDIVIIDPNSLSGLAPSSFAFVQAAQKKLNHTEFINQLLETEMKKNTIISKKHEKIADYSPITIIKEPDKKIVAVICAGASNEREISLESGRNILYKLSQKSYQVLPFFLSEKLTLHLLTHELLVLNSTQEIQACLHQTQEWTLDDLKNNVDFVFIALHGGDGENGSLQGALEILRIPYNGSGVLASALCMDKYKTSQLLKAAGFSTPKNRLVPLNDSSIESININDITFPIIVKPHNDGCSVGVHKVQTHQELTAALHNLKKNLHTHALIEEYIEGMELTVGVIGNTVAQALPPSATIAAHSILSIEEKFLPGAGENQTPAPLPDEKIMYIQKEIERVYETIGCSGYARIDCFYQHKDISPTGKDRVVILEVNTLPGLTPATVIFHQAAEIGMSPTDFLHTIIQLGFEKHGLQKHVGQLQSSPKNSDTDIAHA